MIAFAYLNRGRWVYDCPRTGCGWAYYALTADGRPKYLCRCEGGPDMNGRGWVKGCGQRIELVWPELPEAIEMEAAVWRRDLELTRNSRPGEGADALLAENDGYLVGFDLKRLAEAGIGTV